MKYFFFKHKKTKKLFLRCLNYTLPDRISSLISFISPSIYFNHFQPFQEVKRTSSSLSSTFDQNTPEKLRLLYNIGETFGGKSIFMKQGYFSFSYFSSFFSLYFLFFFDFLLFSHFLPLIILLFFLFNVLAVTSFLKEYYSEDDLQSFYLNYYPKLHGTPISSKKF